jgi:TolA-binding protein
MRHIVIFSAALLLAATDLQAQPVLYGPNKNELVLQNQLDQQREAIMQLSRQIQTLHERVGGMTTVIEGLNRTVAELQASKSVPVSRPDTSGTLVVLEAKVARLESECVKRDELKDVARNSAGNGSEKKPPKEKEKAVSATSTKSNAALYSEGVRLFQKHKYSEAKKRFVATEDKGYKPAASNYYLGEIAYYTKNYQDAIFYFKKSAGLYDKASYIDTLLLHTAISLEKTGDKAQAKIFYQTVIDDYPEKESARIAKKKIDKL